MSDFRWMEEALVLARKAAEEDEVPVGAIIVSPQGEIIAKRHNLREKDQNPLAHAEILAIQDAARVLKSWRLTNCTLVVTLEPCPMCLAACQQARMIQVVYGAKDPKGGALSLGYSLHEDPRTHHRFNVVQEVNIECSEILSRFFQKKRKHDKLEK
jgi:tRNA(adenine34) deaminase